MPLCSVAVYGPCGDNGSLPSSDVTRTALHKAVGEMCSLVYCVCGRAASADDGLFRMRAGSRDVL